MKLSEKGYLKLFCKKGECLADIKEREFESDDFQDAVILTVEEAKLIKHLLDITYCTYILDEKHLVVDKAFNERIIQAEKLNETNKER